MNISKQNIDYVSGEKFNTKVASIALEVSFLVLYLRSYIVQFKQH